VEGIPTVAHGVPWRQLRNWGTSHNANGTANPEKRERNVEMKSSVKSSARLYMDVRYNSDWRLNDAVVVFRGPNGGSNTVVLDKRALEELHVQTSEALQKLNRVRKPGVIAFNKHFTKRRTAA
jgi:hypothetical protein